MLIAIALILAGFFLLIWSADLLVDNASELASRLGVSTFLVGVIVVGFGTSAPEMFVSAMAAFDNKGNLALGNALGSNITNIGLVLGAAAVVRAMPVALSAARIDIPIVIATGLISVFFVSDGILSNVNGYLLLLLLAVYLIWSARQPAATSQKDTNQSDSNQASAEAQKLSAAGEVEIPYSNKPTVLLTVLAITSIGFLMVASKMLVSGAVTVAQYFGVGELVIGLTIVAIGTSLPELAAAVAAARKGVHDMIIGNIIGSNIFNTLGVLGITGAIQATHIDTGALARDFPIMLGFTVLMLVFALSMGRFGRREGAIMLLCYVGYICYLVFTTIE